MSVRAETLGGPTAMSWQTRVRALCAGIAAIVLIDAALVQAPFLAFLCVPFVITAVGLRKGHLVSLLLVLAWAALYVVLAVNYVVANRLDAPAGDLLFAYVGGVLAAAVVVITASRLPRSRR